LAIVYSDFSISVSSSVPKMADIWDIGLHVLPSISTPF
jgi:hypothetical protein